VAVLPQEDQVKPSGSQAARVEGASQAGSVENGLKALMPGNAGEAPSDGAMQLQPLTDFADPSDTALAPGGGMSPGGLDLEGSSAEAEAEGEGGGVLSETRRRLWRIRPVVGVAYAQDSNIFLSNTNPVSSSIYSAAIGGSFELGDYRDRMGNYLILNYLGVGYVYGSAPAQNCYNQLASFLGQYTWNKLRAQFQSQYQNLNGASRQVGNFLKSTLYYNALRFIYAYSEKTSVDLEFSQRSNIYPGFYDSYFNQVTIGSDYRITEKVRLGMEGILGSNPAEQSPTRYYQILNGRIHYDLTGKLALNATVGIQTSQYASGGVPFRATPVLSIGADYKLFGDAKDGALASGRDVQGNLLGGGRMRELLSDSTISLNIYRNQQNSPNFQGQDYLATGVEVGFNKSLGRHWIANISLGYENDTYIANQQGVTADRVDNYFFIQPGITYRFLKYMELTLFYERSLNNSTQTYFSWVDNRIGMELKSAF
jgi:hypothetical protein